MNAITEPVMSTVRPSASGECAVERGTEPSMVGQVIDGKYEITATLGVGGMSAVYEARDLVLERRVALKIELAGHNYSLEREAQALAAIRHPGFATVYQLGRSGDAEYLVMERIFGETLEARLDELAKSKCLMPLGEVLDILIGVTDALAAGHRAGVAQRDLKPANVILAGERVVLVDFGLFIPEVLVSPENEVSGTPEYLAPEVLLRAVERGQGPLIDLYSLGVLAFETLTNATPFADDDVGRIVARHVAAEPPDVGDRREMPVELSALVDELLAKNPRERPASAEAVLWQLKHIRSRELRPRRGMRVVAIDDDLAFANALMHALEAEYPGVEVRAATDYHEALRHPLPEVVLVDLQMPGANGLEVCMELMSLPTTRRPLVVAMSANAAIRDVEVLAAIGVRHFVPKGPDLIPAMGPLIGRVRQGELHAPRSIRP